MFNKLCKLSLVTSVSAAALLTACGGGGGGGDAGQGTLGVSMTDAPACGYDAVNVTVNKVRVHSSSNAGDNDSGWTDIALNPARKINLLDLTNGVLTELGETSLPAGHYTQLRLVLDPNNGNSKSNSIVLSSDPSKNEISLDTPSGAQSGIKVINGFDVAAGQKTDLVLDFDACKSIVTKGSGGYALKPVIKVIPTVLNGINGYVNTSLLNSHVMVTAQQNGAVVSGTAPDKTGKFFLARLPAGNYDVVITADNHAAAVIANVPVASATSTVSLSTSAAAIDLDADANPRTIKGTVTTSPANTTDEVPLVTAKQTFSSGPTVAIKYRGADVLDGTYTLDQLPSITPKFAQYSATLPINLAPATPTQGAGQYKVEASLTGYATQTATVTAFSNNTAQQDFALALAK